MRSAPEVRLRLPSLPVHPWGSALLLALLAVAGNQLGVEVFYGARFHLGSGAVVLALLLLGNRGLPVAAAALLLVPRLWQEPQVLIVQLAEIICLWLYLHLGDSQRRRENGWIVIVAILFWLLVAIPLDFLLFGVVANVDLSRVLDQALLQAINGAFNVSLAYGLYVLIRLFLPRRDANRCFSVRGLTLISSLALILLFSLACLSFGVHQFSHQVSQNQLMRFRHAALISTALNSDALDDLSSIRRQAESPLDFQVFDGRGQLLYDSNPALFETLESRYALPPHRSPGHPPMPEPLHLVVPADPLQAPASILRGYWRYESGLDQSRKDWPASAHSQDRLVVVVEPARNGIRDLQAQSSRAIRLLALIIVLASLVAEMLARLVDAEFPDPVALSAISPDGEWGTRSARLVAQPRSRLRELRSLLQAMQRRGEALVTVSENLRRSELQRHRLETEVSRLNILDPITGCFNRRELYRRLDHELRLSEREQRDLSFLCLEIDHLSTISDSYGKAVCEEILRRVAMELRSRSRATDFFCRLGSEQFGLLLPACDTASAERVADVLAAAVSDLKIRHEGSILAVTLSVGVASLQPGRDDPDSLISRTQSALYRAKAEGRNRVVVA